MTYSDYAKQFIGAQEGDSIHHQIIDGYNKIKPLPRGYAVSYTDAWCAAFVSFILSKCGATKDIYECGVQKMYNKAYQQGLIVKNPSVNDIIFYEWGDDPVLDHVGIISDITGNSLTVIEGNKGHACAYRTIDRRSDYVYGFARVPATVSSSNQPASVLDLDKAALEVIRGTWGNEPARSEKMREAGFTDKQIEMIQKKVNDYYNKEKDKPAKMSLYNVAKDIVVNGNWGNGSERWENLRKAGYTDTEIDQIQSYINDILS